MGNANSNVSDGVKAQAGTSTQKIYQLADIKGGGVLVELTKQATATKNYAALDEAIQTRIPQFVYNNGEGKIMHVSEIVLLRNKKRPKHLQLLKNETDYDSYQPPEDKDPTMYKLVCWRMDERGAVGESIIHICLLNATAVHSELAKRLIRFYPKLINDVYESDEYYGENVLHMAIVNEDCPMVKYFLDNGVDVGQRCSGSFMGPEDQKISRTDSLKHEWVDRDLNTNYEGHVYWGEFPASFAACLGQEECYRLILAKGADPNAQDTNGNSVLHILVIHDKVQMFDMAYELGAEINIKNFINLTPLTLAAKLARREMFFHILNIEREIYWQIGSVTCAAYPLTKLDTIDTTDGGIQKESALNLIVFGEKVDHLNLMEGPVIDLLHAKWSTFVKFRFYKQFFTFFIYFLITVTAFVSRPSHKKGASIKHVGGNATSLFGGNSSLLYVNQTGAEISFNSSLVQQIMNISNLLAFPGNISESMALFDNGNFSGMTLGVNDSLISGIAVDFGNGSELNLGGIFSPKTKKNQSVSTNEKKSFVAWINCNEEPKELIDWIRLGSEVLMLLGAVSYILGGFREMEFLGASMFFENLATAPSRVLFLISCHMVLVMAVVRFLCIPEVEDLVALCIMMSTAPYFLFFCRGFKTVGPFVVMIYRMLSGDLLRFVIIYLIFVMGFSQAYFVIFLSFKNPPNDNPLGTPAESIVSMFMVSLSSFDNLYENFKHTEHEMVAKLLFVIYMAIVAILLINMLIAMMGNTYTKIAETKNEWQRQWARIVLVVERGVHPKQRLLQQRIYSQPMGESTRALVLRLNQSEDEKEEMKEMMDLKRYHDKAIQRRLNKLMAARGSMPRHSIANSLLAVSMNH